MKTLYLNVKGKYFDEIACGKKLEEYRLVKPYWTDRLLKPEEYQRIVIRRGYPKKGDTSKEITRPYRGWEIKQIQHEEFGNETVLVYAIKVNSDQYES